MTFIVVALATGNATGGLPGDTSVFNFDWWVALVVGILIGGFLTPIFADLLPNNIQLRTKYATGRVKKFFSQPVVPTTLVLKTEDMSSHNLEKDSVIDFLASKFAAERFEVSRKGDGLASSLTVGGTRVEFEVAPAFEPKEDKLLLTQLQVDLNAECRYRRFVDQVLELTQGQRRIEAVVRSVMPDFAPSTVLVCRLRSLHEFTGFLAEYKIDALTANLGDQAKFDLASDRVIVYADTITASITSFLKKLIVIYY